MGTLAYSPGWARPASCPAGTDKCLPASPEYFADFARAAAQRYGSASPIANLRGSISAWQIWNEPNHYPFVQPTVDVVGYTTLLKRAYAEIKGVDTAATVLAGATAPAPDDPSGRDMSPMTFLRGIYRNGGKGFFDAFAHHPYSFPCNPLVTASWNAFTQTRYLHDLMIQFGDGAKKIWGTEAGAPTGADIGACTAGHPGRSVTEATQSQFVADYFKGWYGDYASFTGPLFWFQIRDNGTNRSEVDDNLGLLRRDFTQKPAYRTFQRLIRS
jgi:polysaccharide biosynthesis protein PslG